MRQAVTESDFFSVLDLAQSFFQIPLASTVDPILRLVQPALVCIKIRRCAWGCTISTGLLQSALTGILADFYFAGCIIYCDDILAYSHAVKEQHMTLLHRVLDKLRQAGAVLKVAKMFIARTSLTFLGMTLSREGWTIAPKYLASVKCATIPTKEKDWRCFIGLVNWQFLPGASHLLKTLNSQLKGETKDIKEAWTERHTDNFNQIKGMLLKAPLLAHPNFAKPFAVYSDANDLGIGAVLTQGDTERSPKKRQYRVVAYFSRSFTDVEQRYATP